MPPPRRILLTGASGFSTARPTAASSSC